MPREWKSCTMKRSLFLLTALAFVFPLNIFAQDSIHLTGITIFDTNTGGNWTGFFGGSFNNTRGGDQADNLYLIDGDDASGPFLNHGNGSGVGIDIPLANGT